MLARPTTFRNAWVNGKKACDHEGGFTAFDCEVTGIVHDGSNFVVIHVNDQRRAMACQRSTRIGGITVG